MSTSATSRCDRRQSFPCRAASDSRRAGSLAAVLLAAASLATGSTAWAARPSDYNTIDPGVMKGGDRAVHAIHRHRQRQTCRIG